MQDWQAIPETGRWFLPKGFLPKGILQREPHLSLVMPELTQESAYEQAIGRLYERINYEKTGHAPYSDANYRLDRMRRLLSELGDPQLSAPVIHIAGTKGKGSTASFISRMLTAAGLRTGLYTSPHLLKLEERFQVNSAPCTRAQLVELVEATSIAADRVEAAGGGKATFFELTTAVALLHFVREKAQAIVLEVGLGGRLDSTNVCQPSLCVITTIGLDHQAQLGDTIPLIAGEKAGIIKPGIPVVSSARHPDARRVISRVAAQHDAPLRLIERDFSGTWSPLLEATSDRNGKRDQTGSDETGSIESIARAEVRFEPHYVPSLLGSSQWNLSMLGRHHLDNLSAALATIDWLAEQGWTIPVEPLRTAVQQTCVPARLQIVGQSPARLIDTAHNADSIAATLTALDIHFPRRPKCLILATSRDKDIDAILKWVMPACHRLILTQYHNNPRGLPLDELVHHARAIASHCEQAPIITEAATPASAWQIAQQTSTPQDLICATGSFFLAAELLENL